MYSWAFGFWSRYVVISSHNDTVDVSSISCVDRKHRVNHFVKRFTTSPSQPKGLFVGSLSQAEHKEPITRCRATESHVVMTLISGSLSSYDDPLVRKIDPAPAVFSALRLFHGVIGLALIVSPATMMSVAYNASIGNTLVSCLTAMLGGIHIYASIFSHVLKSAAENGRLYSMTYQRLAFGLGAWSFANMVKLAFLSSGSAQLSSICTNAYAFLFAFTLGAQFVCAKGQHIDFVKWNPLRVMENVYGLGMLFAFLGTSAVWIQYFCPDCFLGAQLGSLTWIQAPAGALGKELVQYISTGGFLLFSSFTVLLDASQRGRLGASTFKYVNLGTGLLSFLWAFCLYRLFTDGSMTNLVIGEIFANFAAYKSHLMDIFTYKASLIFPLLGVACFIQYIIAKK